MAPSDACPVCRLYDRTAVAAALLDDLVQPAMSVGQVPPGLGGTIPLARERLQEAVALVGPVRQLTGFDLRQLLACLQQTDASLAGWLTPPAVPVAAAMARECRRQAHAIAWAYFGGVPG